MISGIENLAEEEYEDSPASGSPSKLKASSTRTLNVKFDLGHNQVHKLDFRINPESKPFVPRGSVEAVNKE